MPGSSAQSTLVVGGDIWPTGFDKICGVNPDQHFYVHLDKEKQAEAEGQATVDLTVTTTINGKLYRFGFWITQVRGDMIRALDPGPESGFQLFGDVGT